MDTADYVVVGAGLTGATMARQLADAGREVLVVEARGAVGGNVADAVHPSGIRYNQHGPHYFRTSSARIQQFAERFATFYPFAAVVMSQVDGELFAWPLQREVFKRFVTEDADACDPTGSDANFEAAMLSMMPRAIYRQFVHGYTTKQWGVSPATLEPSLAKRLEVRDDGDPRLSLASFQALPSGGFTAWVGAMLRDIPVRLSTDFHAVADAFRWRRKLIYTGPIDRYFGYSEGMLPYRAQMRSHRFLPDQQFAQPCCQINYPSRDDGSHVRSVEWRHMLQAGEGPSTGTLLTEETPVDADGWNQAEYPFPSSAARAQYQRYAALAADLPDVLICGRLGEYRYLDMDQAIGRALMLADRLLESPQ